LIGAIILVPTTLSTVKESAPVAAFSYVLGLVALLGGIGLVFIFGFMRTQQRQDELADIAPRLEPGEWQTLKTFAGTLLSIRQDISKREIHPLSKMALERSSENLVSEYSEMLNKLKQGTLEVRGPAMLEIFSYFMDGVQETFRALSRDDLNYWASAETTPTRYLEINRKLIERKCQVERIFLISRYASLPANHIAAILHQIDLGVCVRIAFLKDCQDIVSDDSQLDFGLFDTFAVSFWRFAQDRIFKISTAPDECQRRMKMYQRVVAVCVQVRGRTAGDLTTFNTKEELYAWNAALPPA
jgi:hypothetical protein